jgi:hypothetical protein
MEKNRMLYTLLQHGVETTVDRRHKTHRIINWIKQVINILETWMWIGIRFRIFTSGSGICFSVTNAIHSLHCSILSLHASNMIVHGPPWLHFELWQLLNFDFAAGPDPYLASQKMRIWIRNTIGNYGVFLSYLKTAYMYCFYPEGFLRV